MPAQAIDVVTTPQRTGGEGPGALAGRHTRTAAQALGDWYLNDYARERLVALLRPPPLSSNGPDSSD